MSVPEIQTLIILLSVLVSPLGQVLDLNEIVRCMLGVVLDNKLQHVFPRFPN